MWLFSEVKPVNWKVMNEINRQNGQVGLKQEKTFLQNNSKRNECHLCDAIDDIK